jgi:hypothetical protein
MFLKKLLFILFSMIAPFLAVAQSANNFDKAWIHGGPLQYLTTFNGSSVANTIVDTSKRDYFTIGNANICDSFGNLLLCSNGYTVYDKHLNVIDGGDTLVGNELFAREGGWSIYSQSSIFLPFRNGKYYFITSTASDYEIDSFWNVPTKGRAMFDLLLYNVIDMKANSGHGKVISKMVPLLENVQLSKTQMMACKHGDGIDWWLLKQAHDTNMVYKFLFKQDTVLGPFIQGFPEPHFTKWDQSGQSVFSRDGTKYATTCRGTMQLFVADFDRCSGVLSNPKVYDVPRNQFFWPSTTIKDEASNGLAFSPNGRFVYVNGWSYIQQIDLQVANPNNSWVNVANADTTADFQYYSSMYLGPDDKLYIGNMDGFSNAMSVINNPNNKGTACNFCSKCLRFPSLNYRNMHYNVGITSPPCMPNYRLGATNPVCWPVGIEQTPEKIAFSIYPNPATTELHFEYNKPGIVQLSDVTGRLAKSVFLSAGKRSQSVAITSLPPGLYLYRYLVTGQVIAFGKVVSR